MIDYFRDTYINRILEQSSLIAFDVNGLIIDDEPLQIQSANQALRRLGVSVSEHEWLETCFGRRSSDYFSTIVRRRGMSRDPLLVGALVREKDMHYRILIADNVRQVLREGVMDFIVYLSARTSLRLAIVTSASPAELECVLGDTGLRVQQLFDVIVCGGDVRRSKPDPEPYMRLLNESGVEPSRILAFEDSHTGVASATGAFVRCIAVPNTFTRGQDFGRPLGVLSDFTRDAVILLPPGTDRRADGDA